MINKTTQKGDRTYLKNRFKQHQKSTRAFYQKTTTNIAFFDAISALNRDKNSAVFNSLKTQK